MKVFELTQYLEQLVPINWQEGYDNSGLLVGDPEQELTGALISLDCTEEVLEEALQLGYNLIISHHPLVFKGMKRINGENAIERIVMKAIKHDVAIYAIHTNLDNFDLGVNAKIAEKLDLVNTQILAPKSQVIKQLVVYVPLEQAEVLRSALFQAGAGNIGNYQDCSFSLEGVGSFRPKDGARPFSGEIDKLETVIEKRIEVVFPAHLEGAVLKAMWKNHPYEEVAYQVVTLDNKYQGLGAGRIGELKSELSGEEFLAFVKKRLNTPLIRYTRLSEKPIKRVAVCGGSGSFLLKNALRAGADAYVSGDFKYHEFFEADDKILIMDVGHFESEQFTQELLMEIIQKKFLNFAVRLTEVNTNPINYYF